MRNSQAWVAICWNESLASYSPALSFKAFADLMLQIVDTLVQLIPVGSYHGHLSLHARDPLSHQLQISCDSIQTSQEDTEKTKFRVLDQVSEFWVCFWRRKLSISSSWEDGASDTRSLVIPLKWLLLLRRRLVDGAKVTDMITAC